MAKIASASEQEAGQIAPMESMGGLTGSESQSHDREAAIDQHFEELAQINESRVIASHTEVSVEHSEEMASNKVQSHVTAYAEEMAEFTNSKAQSHAPSTGAQSPIKYSEAPPFASMVEVQETGKMHGLDNSRAQLNATTSHSEAPTKHVGGPPLDCVVKVFCMHSKPNFSQPWQMKHQYSSSSSGFIISDRRLLTTAHSVQHHTQVKVKKRGSDMRFLATVLAIGRECDLALLTVDSDEFWEDQVSFIEFGDLPSLQDAVTAVGYPVGGHCMSVTSGVVSRIEITSYPDGMKLLVVQIDAAINAGNFGGPAFNDKALCVGVAFQKLSRGHDNIGYIIPTPVITHFIFDYDRNGEYTGFPTLGIMWAQRLVNPDLRKAFRMDPHLKGIRIREVAPTSSAAKILQPSDILLSFDGVTIGNDGTVPFYSGESIHYSYLVSAKYTGEKARIEILRESVMKSFDIELQAYKPLIPKETFPSYYIIGGIVFTVVTEPYLVSEFGKDFRQSARPSLKNHYANSTAQTKDEELVIVSQILAAEINIDYEDCSNCQVIFFNGTLINNLKQLVHLVETCKEPFLGFELEHHQMLVLDTVRAKKETPKILEFHRIPCAISEDLVETVKSSLETEAFPCAMSEDLVETVKSSLETEA